MKLNQAEEKLIKTLAIQTGFTEAEIMAFYIEMGNTFIITVMDKKPVDVMKDFKNMVRAEPKLKIIVDIIKKSVKSASKLPIQINNHKN